MTTAAEVDDRTVLAIDVGGTKIATAVVDREGVLLRSAAEPTPRDEDPELVWDALRRAVDQVDPEGVLAVGVGTSGPMTRGGVTVSPVNIPGWNEFPLLSRLQAEYVLPVVVDNDGIAIAVAEGWRGAAAGLSDFIAMVVSTGVGGGLVVDGHVLHGTHGNAGHIGHVVVTPGGELCGCTGRGCLETEVSGTAIARRTGGHPADAPAEERVRAGRLLGQAVASITNLLDLQLVTVGGSVALGYGEPFFAAANEALHATSQMPYTRDCRIVPAGLGKDGPLIGAAALAWRLLGVQAGPA